MKVNKMDKRIQKYRDMMIDSLDPASVVACDLIDSILDAGGNKEESKKEIAAILAAVKSFK